MAVTILGIESSCDDTSAAVLQDGVILSMTTATQAIHQKYLVVYEKHFRRTFIHVVDVGRAMTHMIENFDALKHKIYNVGHESLNFTKEDIVNMLKERIDFLVYFAEFCQDEDRRDYEVDYSRIRETGFEMSVISTPGWQSLSMACHCLRFATHTEMSEPYVGKHPGFGDRCPRFSWGASHGATKGAWG